MIDRIWIIGPDGKFRPGFYRTKLAKGAAWVPVWLAEIPPPLGEDGEPLWDFLYRLTVDGVEHCPFTGGELGGEPISEADYRYMLAVRDWAVDHAPTEPEARPTERVDLRAIAPIF